MGSIVSEGKGFLPPPELDVTEIVSGELNRDQAFRTFMSNTILIPFIARSGSTVFSCDR